MGQLLFSREVISKELRDKEGTNFVVVGLDLSLNGPGYVTVDMSGGISAVGYLTHKLKKFGSVECIDALNKLVCGEGRYMQSVMKPRKAASKSKGTLKEDGDIFAARRRLFTTNAILEYIRWSTRNIVQTGTKAVVVMEDYAYSSKSTGQMELAEISGLIRNWLYVNDIPLRLLDPVSVKLFGTGTGRSKKRHMRGAAEEGGFAPPDLFFDEVKVPHPFEFNGKYYTHDLAGPGTDMVDAYFLAMYGRLEILLRRGIVSPEDILTYERKEFMKVTKTRPTNVLSRPYIAQDGKADWVDGG